MGGHGSGMYVGTSGFKLLGETSKMTDNFTASMADTLNNDVTGGFGRNQLMSEATTEQVRKIINELYRPNAETGDGGTADAIREQLRTGNLVGSRDHIRKGRERLRQIDRLLKKQPDHPDRDLLIRLRNDLNDALGGN